MPKRFLSPRNDRSRSDRIQQREVIKSGTRNVQSRNDMIAQARSGNVDLDLDLSGTAIAGGVTEAQIVTGGETLILTVLTDTFVPDIGDDNSITTALIDGITGSDTSGTGWNDEVAITAANVVRTSDTIVTITLPAASGYSIAADETISVNVPGVAMSKGDEPPTRTFVITEGV